MNLSILDLLKFCKNSDPSQLVDVNNCETWLTVRFVRSGLEAKKVSSIAVHANYSDVNSKWTEDGIESSKIWVIDPLWESLNIKLVNRRLHMMEVGESTPEDVEQFEFSIGEIIEEIEKMIAGLDETETTIMNKFHNKEVRD